MGEPRTVFWIFVLIFIAETGLRLSLEWCNERYRKRCDGKVPPIFADFVDENRLKRMAVYGSAKSRFTMVRTSASDLGLLILITGGFLPFLKRWLMVWPGNEIASGLLFFFIPGLLLFVLDLPFDWYHTFVIEEKYGFNVCDRKTWILDRIKLILIALPLFSLLLAAILVLIQWSPASWWLWAVVVVCATQLLLTVLYPVWIAPLFNRFDPIEDQSLKERIESLMAEAGVELDGIYQMDASRRNRHTNAYFTGLGRAKRIVLFDTLLGSHPGDEIIAILAHELGHYHKKHLLKQFLVSASILFAGFYATNLVLKSPVLYRAFGFQSVVTYAGLFLLSIIWQKAGFFVRPILMALARHFEREADSFAVLLTRSPVPMGNALKRLAADNLANLMPHPSYVKFHYSHPSLVERVNALTSYAAGALPATKTETASDDAGCGSGG